MPRTVITGGAGFPGSLFAREVLELTGSESKLAFQSLPQGYGDDPKARQPDVTRASEILGWEPKVSRRDGLLRTIDYFRDCLNIQ